PPFRELDPRSRLCFLQVRARSPTTRASTAPARSGRGPLPTASTDRLVSRATSKARRGIPDRCTPMGSLVQKTNRVTDQSIRGQRATANSFRSLGCNAEHGRWPRVWDRCARERSARARPHVGLAVPYSAQSEVFVIAATGDRTSRAIAA